MEKADSNEYSKLEDSLEAQNIENTDVSKSEPSEKPNLVAEANKKPKRKRH